MQLHNITSAVYFEQGNTAPDAPVIATMLDGSEQQRWANDNIQGGGMLAFIANGKETINVKYA